jgi:flagellar biosynthetic protein FliP
VNLQKTDGTTCLIRLLFVLGMLLLPTLVFAASPDFKIPGIEVRIGAGSGSGQETATALKIVIGLTLLALAPGIIVAMTSFTRIVVVFSMLRHALGLQDTPPNTVLISLALFLTLFIMSPVLERIDNEAFEPLNRNEISASEAVKRGAVPLKEFMLRQTREQDLALMAEISNHEAPRTIDDVSLVQLVPAYMLSELKSAFQIGFVIFLPFLIVDIVVSSILMALGMMMVPPVVISLPFKILLFVMIDGWALIVRALVGSFG